MIGFYDYTVLLTYCSLISATLGILAMSTGDKSFIFGIMCLLISGICDCFDGAVARTKKDRTPEEKKNGIQIDSLTDLVAFGVLPVSIVLNVAKDYNHKYALYFVGVLYVLNAMIRLAYYNVTEELRQEATEDVRQYYEGLPVTFSSIILPLVYLVFKANPKPYIVCLAIVAMLFVIPFKIKKIHIKL